MLKMPPAIQEIINTSQKGANTIEAVMDVILIENEAYPSLYEYLILKNWSFYVKRDIQSALQFGRLTYNKKPSFKLKILLCLMELHSRFPIVKPNSESGRPQGDLEFLTLTNLKLLSFMYPSIPRNLLRLENTINEKKFLGASKLQIKELIYLDYISKLIKDKQWMLAIREFNSVVQRQVLNDREDLFVPEPNNPEQIGIRYFVGRYQADSISACAKFHDRKPIYLIFSSKTAKLRQLFEEKYKIHQFGWQALGGKPEEKEFSCTPTSWLDPWRLFFDSEIEQCMDTEGISIDEFIGKTLDELLRSNNINSLVITPTRWINEINLSSGYYWDYWKKKGNGCSRSNVLDNYQIIYSPSWHLKKSVKPINQRKKLPKILIVFDTKLRYSLLEAKLISKIAKNSGFDSESIDLNSLTSHNLKSEFIKKTSSSRIKYLALCMHGLNGEPSPEQLWNSAKNILTPDLRLKSDLSGAFYDIPKLSFLSKNQQSIEVDIFDLAQGNLCNCEIVFANVCCGTKIQHSSIFLDASIAHSFLASGAKNVITTNSYVDDILAFRFGVEFWKRVLEEQGDICVEDTFQGLCLETKYGKLPWHFNLIKEGDPLLSELISRKQKKYHGKTGVWKVYQHWQMRPST